MAADDGDGDDFGDASAVDMDVKLLKAAAARVLVAVTDVHRVTVEAPSQSAA